MTFFPSRTHNLIKGCCLLLLWESVEWSIIVTFISYWLLYVLLAYFTCPKIRFLPSQEFTLHSINGKRYVYSLMFICIRTQSWAHALSSDTRTDCRLRQADSADSTTTCVFKTFQRHDQSEEEVVHLPTVSKHNFWIRNTNRLQEKRHKGVFNAKTPPEYYWVDLSEGGEFSCDDSECVFCQVRVFLLSQVPLRRGI